MAAVAGEEDEEGEAVGAGVPRMGRRSRVILRSQMLSRRACGKGNQTPRKR